MRPAQVLLLLALLARAGDTNLLPNGDFGKGEEGWVFFQLDPKDAREIEKGALHVTRAAKSPNRPAMIWTDYALDPGQEGTLRFSIRAKGRKLGRTQVLFILWDVDGNTATQEMALDGDPGPKWKTFEKEIEVNGPAKGGRILIRLFDDGELWLDDASVVRKGAPETKPAETGPVTVAREWTPLPGSEGLKVRKDGKVLRLERGGVRLYPEMGVQQVSKLGGRRKEVTLRCRAGSDGARPCVALLAETEDGALVAYARAEPSGDLSLPLKLDGSARRLRIVLAIRGPGAAWFEDVRLE